MKTRNLLICAACPVRFCHYSHPRLLSYSNAGCLTRQGLRGPLVTRNTDFVLSYLRQVVVGLEAYHISGLGPKRAQILHRELGIRTIEDLRQAVVAQRVREIKGFGAKTEEAITRQTKPVAK